MTIGISSDSAQRDQERSRAPSSEASRSQQTPGLPGAHAARQVLIVDEEESLRHMLALLLSREGYVTRSVATLEQAVGELDLRPFDVMLFDLRLPDTEGLAFLEEVRRRPRCPTIITMSAYGGVEVAMEAMKRGAYDYIAKPFKPDEVILVLRKAEERERLYREGHSGRSPRPTAGPLARPEREATRGLESIIAHTPQMLELFRTIKKISEFKTTVLILGESGTGKELVARAIHQQSPRVNAPLVAVNCGAIPATLLESELFGHRKGAFTDAVRDKRGLFEEASGGTLFLDEIGEMPLGLQVKLLRVLQEQEVRPLGSTMDVKVDTRVIAATVRDLHREVLAGHFREDLYYRLNVLPLHLPPLRERKEDIPALVEHFIVRMNHKLGTRIEGVTEAAAGALNDHGWPGNIRELENTIERAVVMCEERRIDLLDLPERLTASQEPLQHSLSPGELSIKKTTRAVEEELIRRALKKTRGNRTSAAKILEISHRALLYKIKEFGISAK